MGTLIVIIVLVTLNYYYHSIKIAPTFKTGLDKFGIEKIYSTKPGGEEWFMTIDPKDDPRFHSASLNLVRNDDGSFKITSTEVRLGVYTSIRL